jgi:Tol biopolymer transport system component
MTRILRIGVAAVALTALAVPAAAAPVDAPQLVSRADGRSGALANRRSVHPSISNSGRYVAFSSEATNLRKNGDPPIPSAYLRDTYRRRTTFVSDFANHVLVSSDSYLVLWDTGVGDTAAHEIYLKRRGWRRPRALPDLVRGLPPARDGLESHDLGSISGDNFSVAFTRQTSPSGPQPYVADLKARRLIPVIPPTGRPAPNGPSEGAEISSYGRVVLFTSQASNLVPGDTNGAPDAFVSNLETGEITLVDRTASGAPADRGAQAGAISQDGRYVTFNSPSAENGVRQVYLRDLVAGTTTAVSRRTGAGGALGNRDAGASSISGDGRRVVFATRATNLSHRQCSRSNVVLRDVRRSTTRVIRRPARLSRHCAMTEPAITGGYSRVAFTARGTVQRRTPQVYVARFR